MFAFYRLFLLPFLDPRDDDFECRRGKRLFDCSIFIEGSGRALLEKMI